MVVSLKVDIHGLFIEFRHGRSLCVMITRKKTQNKDQTSKNNLQTHRKGRETTTKHPKLKRVNV